MTDDELIGRQYGDLVIVAETLKPPPKRLGVTHWSSRLLAERLKVGNATVARAVAVLDRPRSDRFGVPGKSENRRVEPGRPARYVICEICISVTTAHC